MSASASGPAAGRVKPSLNRSVRSLCPRLEAEDTGPDCLAQLAERTCNSMSGSLQPGRSRNRRSWIDETAQRWCGVASLREQLLVDVPLSRTTGHDPKPDEASVACIHGEIG